MTANEMFHRVNLQLEGARLADTKFNEREVEDFLNKSHIELTKQRFDQLKNRTQRGYGDGNIRDAELEGLLTGTAHIPRENYMLGSSDRGDLRGPDLDNADQEPDKYGVYIPVPDEAMYVTFERATVEKDGIIKDNTRVQNYTYSEYDRLIYDKYMKPYPNLVWSIGWGSYTPAQINGLTEGDYTNSTKENSLEGTGNNMSGVNYLGETVNINTRRAKYVIPGKGWKVTSYFMRYIKVPREIRIDLQTPSLQVNSEFPSFMHQELVDMAVKLAASSLIPSPNDYQVHQLESKEDE